MLPPRTRRSRAVSFAATAAGAALLLTTACGGGGGGGGSGAAGATFVMAAAGVPGSLDYQTTFEGDSSRVVEYEQASTLVEYDASASPDKGCATLPNSEQLRANLASSWQYNADRTQLVFTLREGVRSPAGNTMTADDVVWSMTRSLTQSATTRFFAFNIAHFRQRDTFQALDEKTVAVNLEKPTTVDAVVFTIPHFAVLDRREIETKAGPGDALGAEWLKTHTADFGPWALDSFTPSSKIVYKQNPNFWNKEERGDIATLIIQNVPETSTRLQLLETGQADYAARLSFDQYKKLEKSDKADLVDCVSANRDTMLLNENYAPFADLRVRLAISEAIDRKALVDGVYKGLATPSTTGLSDVYWTPPGDAERIEFDPDNAKALLAQAGVSNLQFAIVASPTRPGAYAQSLAVQIQGMLSAVGVQASIDVIPGATEFSDTFYKSKYQAMIYLEPPALGDPFYSTALYSYSGSYQNTFKYHNDIYDQGVRVLQATASGPERDAALRQVSDVVVQTVPMIYLTEARTLLAFGAGISGYENASHGQLMVYRLNKR